MISGRLSMLHQFTCHFGFDTASGCQTKIQMLMQSILDDINDVSCSFEALFSWFELQCSMGMKITWPINTRGWDRR